MPQQLVHVAVSLLLAHPWNWSSPVSRSQGDPTPLTADSEQTRHMPQIQELTVKSIKLTHNEEDNIKSHKSNFGSNITPTLCEAEIKLHQFMVHH
jgi:hypothetical protein